MLTVTELLLRSYRLYRKHVWTLLGYAAWLLLPSAAFLALEFSRETYQDAVWFIPVVLLVATSVIFLGLWLTIILTKLCAVIIDGKTLDLKTLQHASWMLITPLLAVTFLQTIIVTGGALLFIIPGLIFLVWYAFAQFALILDGTRGLQSLSQSKQLVQGRFWIVTWKLVSGPIIITFIYTSILVALITTIGLATGAQIEPLFEEGAPLWVGILESIADMFVTPMMLMYFTLLYIELKNHPVTPPVENDKQVA
ncbi:hypothetical protein CO174_05000 [Candidatus Uhrbacteria bacterium CG_4_9_14_3_um_filter_50_9]|uniref:Glycerophosphoryl diester phosphodiesterase membrane domain-containing protein n=1 Tax=Candidatus Uhrbacteria bacterium CG_4_9_14_3_um_filter_50_9 TaxID=1975035 RepID=A0A2M7XBD9_9BACT|nr:MAG: hypothetical protein CO174_05000 [Candidatus Uhrbacteria bacterium CG_4_9_14_3_um_filter_50_9]